MNTMVSKAKLKFKVGEKVYYKHGTKVRTTTIRKIILESTMTKKGVVQSLNYVANAYPRKNYHYSNYKRYRFFKESEIFNSQEAAKKGMIPTEKTEILKHIKKMQKRISGNKQSITAAKQKLEEIKKEELIEELSGI